MYFITERTQADNICKNIKEAVKESSLDYFIQESPFTLHLKIKKTFMKDFSPPVSNQDNPAFISNLEGSNNPVSSPNSSIPTYDSGFRSTSDLTEEVEEAKKELVKTIVETNKTIADLRDDINTKDLIINKLNSEINSLKDTSNNLKNELNIKTEQLKQKNKSISSINSKLENTIIEKDTLIASIENNVENLKKQNLKLSSKNEKISKDLKQAHADLKRIEVEKQNKRETSTQTEMILMDSKQVQTTLENKPSTNRLQLKSGASHQLTVDPTGTPNIEAEKEHKENKLNLVKCRLLLDILFPHPNQWNQLGWPEKCILDRYMKLFGTHKCDDCTKEDIPFKLTQGTQTSYRQESLPICRNNLVPFDGKE